MIKSLLFVFTTVIYTFVSAQQTPANQPTNLNFINVRAYNFNLNFQPSAADGFLVLKNTQPITFVPQDGIVYETGQGVAGAKVVSVANISALIVNEVVENTAYYIAIFAFNGSGNAIKYKQDNPLTGNVTSAAANIGNYYSGINANASDFLTKLTQKLNNHTFVAYTNYATTIVPAFFERDTTSNQKVVTCEYSGENKVYSPPFSFQDVGYSREHLLPRSWMPTGGATNTAEGADYHNLALTNLNSANSLRSNYPLGEVVTATTTFLDCRLGKNANNITVFEPTDAKKGDAARAIFYQLVCYNGKGGSNWGFFNLPSLAQQQSLATLINWHFNDLPDAAERAKHEYIFSIQNNRNPFIDYPELVDCIDFNQILKTAQCNSTVSVADYLPNENSVVLYPNPARNTFYISINGIAERIRLYDIAGKEIKNVNFMTTSDGFSVNISELNNGSYFVTITLKNGVVITKKLAVN
jgi:hypothetical protein